MLGAENFDVLIRQGGFYVDKTKLLYELVEESPSAVTLFTRPRRFGKTLTMSMIESFFDIRRDSRDVFEGMWIQEEHPAFCEKWMNQYPVLLLSLKDVEGRSYEVAFDKLKDVLAELCKKLAFLEIDERPDADDIKIFRQLKAGTAREVDIHFSLKTLMRMMYAVYERPVIVLIDEYDVPLAKANSNGYYQQMLELVRSFLSISLKSNEYLKFGAVTGCLRIPKESIFTGVNNFACYSVLEDRYASYFGFTKDEISCLLDVFDQADKMEQIREWYDGYVFGNTEIYCPWDVLSYLSDLCKNPDAKPLPYWQNTSGNDSIRAFFDMNNTDISDKFEVLLNGECITEEVTNAVTYEEAYDSEDNLWSILLMTGYVTAVSFDGEESRVAKLRIPNKEIAAIFQTTVVNHFNQTVNTDQIQSLMQALWNGEEAAASEILTDLLWDTISYMDYHEDYYHAFLTGIFVGRGKYAVQSNKENGLGRPDIDLRDKRNRRALIIEAKKSESEERMGYWCDRAIQQIAEREYQRQLKGYTTIRCYGIAFFEKTAEVRLMKG